MTDILFTGSKWKMWIEIIADPHAQMRGFSLIGREFPCKENKPVSTEMLSVLDNGKQYGNFWVIDDMDFITVCPEMAAFSDGKTWLIPVEFAKHFWRPSNIQPINKKKEQKLITDILKVK